MVNDTRKWWISISFWQIFPSFQTRLFFLGEKLAELAIRIDLLLLFMTYILSNFKLFDSLLKKDWWYISSIIDNNLASYTHPNHQLSLLAIFSDETSFSATILILLSHCVCHSLSSFQYLFLFFFFFICWHFPPRWDASRYINSPQDLNQKEKVRLKWNKIYLNKLIHQKTPVVASFLVRL